MHRTHFFDNVEAILASSSPQPFVPRNREWYEFFPPVLENNPLVSPAHLKVGQLTHNEIKQFLPVFFHSWTFPPFDRRTTGYPLPLFYFFRQQFHRQDLCGMDII